MVAGTSCRHAGKVLRDAGNFLYGYSTGAVKLAGMPASCRHLNRERIALERFLVAGMRWISKFAGSGFAGMPVTTLIVRELSGYIHTPSVSYHGHSVLVWL